MTCHNNNHPGIKIYNLPLNLAQFRFFDDFFLVGIVQFQCGYHVGPCASEHLKRNAPSLDLKCPAILFKKMAQSPNKYFHHFISFLPNSRQWFNHNKNPEWRNFPPQLFFCLRPCISSVARSPEETGICARVKVVEWSSHIQQGIVILGKNDPYSCFYEPDYSVDNHLLLYIWKQWEFRPQQICFFQTLIP